MIDIHRGNSERRSASACGLHTGGQENMAMTLLGNDEIEQGNIFKEIEHEEPSRPVLQPLLESGEEELLMFLLCLG